jgi:hypothetical protein
MVDSATEASGETILPPDSLADEYMLFSLRPDDTTPAPTMISFLPHSFQIGWHPIYAGDWFFKFL